MAWEDRRRDGWRMNEPMNDTGTPIEFEYFAISPADSLPEGERLFLEIDNLDIVVFNIRGEFYAIEDRCSHDDGPLGEGELSDHQVICPRHGARFDIKSGNALTLPAVKGVSSFPVQVNEGMIEIGIPKN